MDRLSPEVVDMILDQVYASSARDRSTPCKGQLGQYAAVSRIWQSAIERRTMSRVYLNHQDELDEFCSVFSAKSPHRRRALRDFFLLLELPTVGYTQEDRTKNGTCFRTAISKLLQELASWGSLDVEERTGPTESMELTLRWTAKDPWNPDPQRTMPPDDSFLTLPEDCLAAVPNVSVVTKLRTYATKAITPHPATLCQIAVKFPALERLQLELWEPTLVKGDMRREHRQALAAGLVAFRQTLPRLSSLKIRRQNFQPLLNHSFEYPDLTDADGRDPLSTALRELGEAGTLAELDLFAIPVTSELFRDPNLHLEEPEKQASIRNWPAMRRLSIASDITAANGQWLCTIDPDSAPESSSSDEEESVDSEEETDHRSPVPSDQAESSPTASRPEYMIIDKWRHAPDEHSFNPFVESMMRAVTQHMPCLSQFFFDLRPRSNGLGILVIQCAESGLPFVRELLDLQLPADEREQPGLRRYKAWILTSWNVPESFMEMGRKWIGPAGAPKAVKLRL